MRRSSRGEEGSMGLWCSPMTAGGWVLMAVVWAAILGLVVWAVCRLFPAQRTPDARTTLDARLAAGGLDPDTYRWIREQIDGQTPATKGLR